METGIHLHNFKGRGLSMDKIKALFLICTQFLSSFLSNNISHKFTGSFKKIKESLRQTIAAT